MHGTATWLALRRLLPAALAVLLLSAGPTLPAGAHEEHPADTCICSQARMTNGWCEVCQRGFVASLEVRSRDLYEMIDPHGHDMDLAHLPCAGCVIASRSDGFCEKSEIGFVDGRGYVSRLGYLLALAVPTDQPGGACTLCGNPMTNPGWCDDCGRGRIGQFLFTDRETYEQARVEYRKLEAAIQKSSECALCGVALFADGRCPKCNLFYRDGKLLEDRDITSGTQQRKLP